MTGFSVLCVDPDRDLREELEERLQVDLAGMDPDVEGCGSIADADTVIENGPVDCLVTEYELPDGTGLELASRLRTARPDAGVVLFTGTPPERIDTGDGDAVVTEYVEKTADAALTRVTSLVEMTGTLGGQLSYPLPDDEAERLAALRGYDFEDPDLARSFDHVTDLAIQHFGVESASVNIIEEHEQKLLACKGMDAETRSTSRDTSICTFTIVADDRVMTVEDVREDPRFESQQETFEESDIRAYMGAQVVTPAGFSIGTLCVYDDEPHDFTPADREYLQTLADLVVDLLTLSDREEDGGTDDLSAAEEAFR